MNSVDKTRVLVLGAGGMLGNALFCDLFDDARLATFGTLRTSGKEKYFSQKQIANLISNVDVTNTNDIISVFNKTLPNIVINCVGIIKQHRDAHNPLAALSINAMLPHQLARFCELIGARLVHMSTDCVFSGRKGGYTEDDIPDANDLYGRTKLLGEVDYSNTITLRTSIIGHELGTSQSLIDWFLSQKGSVRGYKSAIFSGLPTVEIARVIKEFVIPNKSLSGIYHLSADSISKNDLLGLVAIAYKKDTEIIPDDTILIDRSLVSGRFRSATGYVPAPWPKLIAAMNENYLGRQYT